MINNMVNLVSLVVIIGVTFGSLLATEMSASSRYVGALPFRQWCQQVYSEAVKPNVRSQVSQAAFKFKGGGGERPNNFWLSKS